MTLVWLEVFLATELDEDCLLTLFSPTPTPPRDSDLLNSGTFVDSSTGDGAFSANISQFNEAVLVEVPNWIRRTMHFGLSGRSFISKPKSLNNLLKDIVRL